MTKKEKHFNLWLKDKNFEPRKLKNIIIQICHGQSIHARTHSCYFCDKGVSKKELKKMTAYFYGIQLGSFYNKRHCLKKEPKPYNYSRPRFFLNDICTTCIGELESKLNFEFKKDFAP